MRRNFTIQNTVNTTVSSMNTAHKTMSSIKFVRTNVLTLFLLFCFWQTGMGQSIFLPGNPPIMGEAPVGINIPPAPGIDFHVNGNIRFQGLPNITLANSFLARDVVGNIFHQTGSLPLLGTALGQSLYWSGTHWQPTSFLHVDPGNIVRIGNQITPISGNYQSDPTMMGPNYGWDNGLAPYGPASPYLSVGGGDIETDGNFYTAGNVFIRSDRSIKTNISKLNDWKKILHLQAYSYQYIGKEDAPLSYGFMAQDVLDIIPEFTATWRGKGAVNYIGFIPFLTKGIQEHEVEIEDLKTKNNMLQSKVEILEIQNDQLERRLATLEKIVYNHQHDSTTTVAR